MPTTPELADLPIPFVTVTNWVRAARLCGIDIETIFREEGLDVSTMHPETATVRRESLQRVMERCVEATRTVGSPRHFPLVLGESFAFEYVADVETFITTSATLRDATRALEWIPPLVNPYMTFSLAEHGHEARIALQYSLPDATPDRAWHFTEGVFATTVKFSRLLLGEMAVIGKVTMRHPPHANSDQVAEYFQVPIEWAAPLDALWFDRALLDQPLRGAFPVLHEQAAQRVVLRVAERVEHAQTLNPFPESKHPLIKQIEQAFDHKPRLLGLGLDALAQELQLHARTLQRRLKELGESHSAIQARVRYQLAQQWLQDESQSIEDISERLGFSDRRSFTLAFTRWSGQTPSQYRRGDAG